jgi:hypothetical protein
MFVKSLGQCADVLQSINHDAEGYSAQEHALNAAGVSLRLSRDGFRAGEVGVLQVLERSAPTSWRCLARSKCERLNVGAALGYAFFFRPVFLRGTFAPARRASDRPMATACLRLVTFFFERPLRNVPVFRSCIARLTLLAAFFP